MKTVSYSEIHILPDMSADHRLMPPGMELSTNGAELFLYKTATRMAMEAFLTAEQRKILKMHYWKGMSKTEIGAQLGITPSCVCKKINAARNVLKRQVEYCISVGAALKRGEVGE